MPISSDSLSLAVWKSLSWFASSRVSVSTLLCARSTLVWVALPDASFARLRVSCVSASFNRSWVKAELS